MGTKTNRVDELFAGAKEKKLAAGFSHTTPSQTVHAKLVKSKFNYTPRNQPICRPQSWLQISFSRTVDGVYVGMKYVVERISAQEISLSPHASGLICVKFLARS